MTKVDTAFKQVSEGEQRLNVEEVITRVRDRTFRGITVLDIPTMVSGERAKRIQLLEYLRPSV